MRGHSSTPLVTCSPIHPPRLWPAKTGQRTVAARLGRVARQAKLQLARCFTVGLASALAAGLVGCDSGYGNYGDWQPTGTVPYTGRTALTWTLEGTPLTAARCQSEKISSMTIQFVSERDRQSAAEFLEVVCDLSRFSAAMVPIGPLRIYVNAIQVLRNQTECVRYAGIGHVTATADYPQTPLSIDLKSVVNCP